MKLYKYKNNFYNSLHELLTENDLIFCSPEDAVLVDSNDEYTSNKWIYMYVE